MSVLRCGAALALLALFSGCDGNTDVLQAPELPEDGSGRRGEPGPVAPLDVASCSGAVGAGSYVGIGGAALEVGRPAEAPGRDRARMKPFTVLAQELTRVTGTTPASLATASTAFGEVRARWDEEPKASALAMATFFNVAFDACLTYVGNQAALAAAPTEAQAKDGCATMMRAFWSRVPDASQIAACTGAVTRASPKEPDGKRRWAYACAAVLSADGFVAY